MEIPIANIYYLLCYAWDALEEKETLEEVGALDSTELLDLFAKVLTNGTRRLLRRGLDRGYVPREGEIAGVRGKLLTTPTLRRDLLRQGRAACIWDELEYDTLPNRILKTTFECLRGTAELDERTRADVRDMLRWLTPVRSLALRAEHFRRVQLHRNNRIYAMLLHVCNSFMNSGSPRNTEAGGVSVTLSEMACLPFSRVSCSTSIATNYPRKKIGRSLHRDFVGW